MQNDSALFSIAGFVDIILMEKSQEFLAWSLLRYYCSTFIVDVEHAFDC